MGRITLPVAALWNQVEHRFDDYPLASKASQTLGVSTVESKCHLGTLSFAVQWIFQPLLSTFHQKILT